MSYPQCAGKRKAVDSARIAPTYVEAGYKVGATTGRASRGIGVRIENRSGAYAAARLKVTVANAYSFASGPAYRRRRRKRLRGWNGVSCPRNTGACLPRYRIRMRLGRESRLRMNNRRLNAERNREREPQKFPSSHGAISASYASISLLCGRPRLRRPFLGGRPTRFGSLIRLAREPCLFGGSTVHPALRSKSIASISSVSCISFVPL